MLSVETKRKIDNARDVLVGKIPNPQAQVEQITTALIYKFMDDMDDKSKTLGGKARFFVGEYEKYSWRTILDPRIGGQERMNLYSEAVQKLSQNPALPQIFRDVFKDAFVPYRDPETLSLFLKEINWFDYHHSEELGNAYEYLLSIMGSQGDAGQFRTPRHIIDFIVEAVDPQKSETVLDPACGTAGFLISTYKHILGANDGLDDITGLPTDKESRLNPEERAKMLKNFTGYDISPEMVRLSLVNMYLHGFVQPRIEEYDSLTYEDHWQDDFDVILANPPFMTPKGGVRPHKKFQIQANRAEVLFVDYIAEHLKPQGRAGIVVPEGIIFQSGGAYKALRKMLVEEQGLWAVISLPAGVFQPYSGVKTSVLILDKARSKHTDEILFIEVKHDGYNLGAQRTPSKNNDFPKAIEVITAWRDGAKTETLGAQWVHKDKIRETSDYVLTGSRHKVSEVINSTYDTVKFSDVAKLVRGVVYSKNDEVSSDGLQVLRANNINHITGRLNLSDIKNISRDVQLSDDKKLLENDIFICLASGSKSHIGKVAFIETDTDYYFGGFMGSVRVLKNLLILPRYLYLILSSTYFNKYLRENISGANINNLNGTILSNFTFPLPPTEVQKQIISELDTHQRIISGAQQVIDYWKPSFQINPDWEIVKLGEYFKTSSGGTPLKSRADYYDGDIPWLGSGEVSKGHITESKNRITAEGLKNSSAKLFPVNTVLVAMYGATVGQVGILDFESSTNQAVCGIYPNPEIAIPEYIYLLLKGYKDRLISLSVGGAQPNISQGIIRELDIPLPPISEQQSIVGELLKEQKAISFNKDLIANFKGKIQSKITEVWGE